MRFPNSEIVKRIKEAYPVGCRVELVHMEDMQAPPIGTRGTVRGVDDIGSIMVSWDNGSGLSVAYGEDSCRKLNSVVTICYGERKVWDDRKEAAEFYLAAMAGSDGHEQSRYTKIYIEIMSGFSECTDEEE